jgi:hypothetical protein
MDWIGLDSNQVPPEYRSEVLLLETTLSVVALPKQQSSVQILPYNVHPKMESELIYKVLWSLY